SIPVGLEPVSVVARTDSEAWVVNSLSDSVSIVDLNQQIVVRTLWVGDEPTDVAFAANRAFVAVSQEDQVKVYELPTLGTAPPVDIFSRKVRALAVSPDGTTVYAVPLRSGNGTTTVADNIASTNISNLVPSLLGPLGLADQTCSTPPPPYQPLPAGITRNPELSDPPDGIPKTA